MKLLEVKSYSTAKRHAPWAAVIAKCEGGYMAFLNRSNYQTWKNQK